MDFNIDILEDIDPEESKWNALVESIVSGNVVPVIGPDFICETKDGQKLNLNDIIISTIENYLSLTGTHQSFSQLVYDPEFIYKFKMKFPTEGTDFIYSFVSQLLNKSQFKKDYLKPSNTLRRLLQTNLFPFVITTSFTSVVELEMKDAWRNRTVKTLSFCNKVGKDREPNIGDITSAEDMSKPTIYYMFGKANFEPNTFVLTDNDMLEFCSSWLSEDKRPKNLSNQLKDKYLLMLGCGYSDWLFRFIWFSMNKTPKAKTKGLMAADETTHESLVEYLRRIDTFLPANKTPEEIIDEIERRVKAYNKEHGESRFETAPKYKTDVFISYSRRDAEVAEMLYKYLSDNGLNVWYDKNNLIGGEKFMDEIFSAIDKTKIFIPILTENVNKESMEAHPYRAEWDRALKIQRTSGDRRTFIIPINEESLNLYDADIPDYLKSHSALSYDTKYDFSKILCAINDALNKLDNFKSLSLD